MGNNPLMDRINAIRQSETAQRVSEGIEDVREKLNESEVVGRFQDMRQRMGEGNEAAVTYKEIRMRHPAFDLPTFLQSIKQEVPVVIKVLPHICAACHAAHNIRQGTVVSKQLLKGTGAVRGHVNCCHDGTLQTLRPNKCWRYDRMAWGCRRSLKARRRCCESTAQSPCWNA